MCSSVKPASRAIQEQQSNCPAHKRIKIKFFMDVVIDAESSRLVQSDQSHHQNASEDLDLCTSLT